VTMLPFQVLASAEWSNVLQDGELVTKLVRAIIDRPPPIAELRQRLAGAGSDIDGSRETLMKRLKSSSGDEYSPNNAGSLPIDTDGSNTEYEVVE
jgi:hypothetical protein